MHTADEQIPRNVKLQYRSASANVELYYKNACANAGALARGDAAILLRFPHKGYREKIWDHAAGVVIVQEAGAVTTDASGTLDMTIVHA